MGKYEYIFKFPALNSEKKLLANPMHIEKVAGVVLMENNAELCIVCDKTGSILFIATWDSYEKFQFYYKDTSKPKDLMLVYGIAVSDAVDNAEGDDIDLSEIHDGIQCIERHFRSQEEADAYMRGVDDAMEFTDGWENLRYVSENVYRKIKNAMYG